MAKNKKIFIYDTTLRDGSQGEGVSFNGEDKLNVAKKLDALGVDYIEGGWPGSNPKDASFFKSIYKVSLKHAKVAAFGSTRRKGVSAGKDKNLNMLLNSEAPVMTIFGKSWDFHVTEVLKTTPADNLKIIESSIAYLKEHGHEVIYDAEHFFDGSLANSEYALETLKAAVNGGADYLVLCDTNGGRIPSEVFARVSEVRKAFDVPVGIHAHNDSELAVANSLAAVEAGATQVQGTINGYGERCGNANLCSVIPNLILKMNRKCMTKKAVKQLMDVSCYVSELANMVPNDKQAYVGRSAFAHKGGMHVNAVKKNPKTFEHIVPEDVGNQRRILISELAGKSNIAFKAKVFDFDLEESSPEITVILDRVKALEHQGYSFEGADASLKILMDKVLGKHKSFFEVNDYRTVVRQNREGLVVAEATLDLTVKGEREHVVADGDGPVNALDKALRKALLKYYPKLEGMYLTDYKVRVLNGKATTAAKVRVLIESRDGHHSWSTVGVSENIVEASWLALLDSVEYQLKQNGFNP